MVVPNPKMAAKNKACCAVEIEQSPAPAAQDPPRNVQGAVPEFDFVEEPDQDCLCPVSLELLLDPCQTSCCGQHISKQAADRLIRERKPCPMCKEDGFTAQPDKFFKRKFINTLKVRCPHKRNGCEWVGELGALNNHSTPCPKRPWKCQYCDLESTFDVGTNEHTPNCVQYPLPCPNQCEIGTVPRCDAEKHLLVCPLQLLECEFANVGCEVKVPRRDLTRHMAENAQHHLMSATLLNLRLTRELHQKMEEKDRQIAELKQQLNEHEVKITEKSTEVSKKLQQQTEYLTTKIQQQTKDLGEKLQEQREDLTVEIQQQSKDLDTKLQQQTKDLETKLQQQTKEYIAWQTKDLNSKLDQQTKALVKEVQQTTDGYETQVVRKLSIVLFCGLSYQELTLTEFTKAQALSYWSSSYFYASPQGYRFNLLITNLNFKHFSCFLFSREGDYDKNLQWPVKGEVFLLMLNQRTDHNHFVAKATFNIKKTGDYGTIENEFYPTAGLGYNAERDTEYVRNGCIKFRMRVEAHNINS